MLTVIGTWTSLTDFAIFFFAHLLLSESLCCVPNNDFSRMPFFESFFRATHFLNYIRSRSDLPKTTFVYCSYLSVLFKAAARGKVKPAEAESLMDQILQYMEEDQVPITVDVYESIITILAKLTLPKAVQKFLDKIVAAKFPISSWTIAPMMAMCNRIKQYSQSEDLFKCTPRQFHPKLSWTLSR